MVVCGMCGIDKLCKGGKEVDRGVCGEIVNMNEVYVRKFYGGKKQEGRCHERERESTKKRGIVKIRLYDK